MAITSLTRNQVVGQPARGFESHRLRKTDKGLHRMSALLLKLQAKDSFTLTLTMKDDAGLSLYSRTSGQYGIGIMLEAK